MTTATKYNSSTRHRKKGTWKSRLAGNAARGALLAMLLVPALSVEGQAQQNVVVTVNDRPISNYDIDQRVRMNNIIGFSSRAQGAALRKETLNELIDEILKVQEAKRVKVTIGAADIDDTLKGMASRSGDTVAGWEAKLKKAGISMTSLRQRIESNLAWNRIIAGRYNINTNIESALVDQRLKAIKSDPARQPRTLYMLQEIRLPVEGGGDEQLLYARFVEAQQIVQRYKGCASAKDATRGVFNVQVRPPVPVQPESLPPQMKAALDSLGQNKLLGPSRSQEGIQLIGYCGKQSIAPPEVSREQIENMLINERVGLYTERYVRELRRGSFIDYKDKSYSQ